MWAGHRRISSSDTAVRKIETGNGWRKLGEKRRCGMITWQTRATSASTRKQFGWIWKEPQLQKRCGAGGGGRLECSEAGQPDERARQAHKRSFFLHLILKYLINSIYRLEVVWIIFYVLVTSSPSNILWHVCAFVEITLIHLFSIFKWIVQYLIFIIPNDS